MNGLGRLDVTRAGTVVTVAQEGAALPFGFKLDRRRDDRRRDHAYRERRADAEFADRCRRIAE